MYKRLIFKEIIFRLQQPKKFIQVLYGPRQVGKTTLIRQLTEELNCPFHYASADEPTLQNRVWVEQQWNLARLKARQSEQGVLLILDEIQKITDWSAIVKYLWDEDSANKLALKVILLGSTPLLIQKGLTESLAGRFEIIPVTHWSYLEMKQAFCFTLDEYIYFGGYPGAADLIRDENRWRRYIVDSLIETTLSRDIFLMTRIDKPALFRQLFQLGCQYSGQVLSYQKMLGQLHDAGNTTTLSHYLQLLTGAGMLTGLSKYSQRLLGQRASSPKLQVLNTALMTALLPYSYTEAHDYSERWGRIVETAIGAHLLNITRNIGAEIYYWREGNKEVDFVVESGSKLIGIEVKSGSAKFANTGMEAFKKKFPSARLLQVGGQGIPLEDFLLMSPDQWIF